MHSSFALYDADSYAPCRYHLLPRVVPPPVLLPNGSVTSSPLPGTAARWRLLADSSGLDRHAQMVHRVNTMYQTYTLYYFLQVRDVRGAIVFRSSFRNFPCRNSYLVEHEFPRSCKPVTIRDPNLALVQGIILLMLIMHLIHAIGFQPRLSVIPGGQWRIVTAEINSSCISASSTAP